MCEFPQYRSGFLALGGPSKATSPSFARARAYSQTFSIQVCMNCLNSSSAGSGAGAGEGPGRGAGSGPREVVSSETIFDSERCPAEPAAEPCGGFWRQSGAILNEMESDGEAEPEFFCLPNRLA